LLALEHQVAISAYDSQTSAIGHFDLGRVLAVQCRFWHLADIRGTATICQLLDKSGQWSVLALYGSAANDYPTQRRTPPMPIKKSELYSSLWASCDELRGGMDASQYKDYVLVLLFIKYVSDKYAGVPYTPITIPNRRPSNWRCSRGEEKKTYQA
jgi:hypothetical protein